MAIAPPGSDSWSPLLEALKRLRASWPQRGWSWDGRFSCVTSTFNSDLEPRARASIAMALTTEWTPTTISQASAPLRDVVERTGGMRSGQIFFASAAVGRAFTFGLWWPWGDGMATSLRIGVGGPDAREEVQARLRDAFGVEA
jgi:hypothetical protein